LLRDVTPLVDLFGRKKREEKERELEASLAELQKETEELLRALEKRDEKVKQLSSALQEARIALKAAEQKGSRPQEIKFDRPELPRLQGRRMSPREIEQLCRRLSSCRSGEDDLLSFYSLKAQDLPSEAQEAAREVGSSRGWIVLRSPQLFTLLLVPPLPVREKLSHVGEAFFLEPLREILETPVLLVSSHAGDTFLGLSLSWKGFEVQELVSSSVKEKHSKGGWSQKRFERLREEDIKGHLEAVLDRLSQFQSQYGPAAKYAILAGDPSLTRQIAPQLGLPIVERKLEKHDQKSLDRLAEEAYSFMCYRLGE
jgi:hypothetical protein